MLYLLALASQWRVAWLVCDRPRRPGRVRLGLDPRGIGFRGTDLRGLWRHLHREFSPLALDR